MDMSLFKIHKNFFKLRFQPLVVQGCGNSGLNAVGHAGHLKTRVADEESIAVPHRQVREGTGHCGQVPEIVEGLGYKGPCAFHYQAGYQVVAGYGHFAEGRKSPR